MNSNNAKSGSDVADDVVPNPASILSIHINFLGEYVRCNAMANSEPMNPAAPVINTTEFSSNTTCFMSCWCESSIAAAADTTTRTLVVARANAATAIISCCSHDRPCRMIMIVYVCFSGHVVSPTTNWYIRPNKLMNFLQQERTPFLYWITVVCISASRYSKRAKCVPYTLSKEE